MQLECYGRSAFALAAPDASVFVSDLAELRDAP